MGGALLSSHPKAASLVERIRAALAGVRGVEEKRMFGSTAFLVRGKLCLSARDSRIMCRIDPATHAVLAKRPGCRTVRMRGRAYPGYLHVGAGALRTSRALNFWVARALDYNRRLPDRKRPK